jgi:hypothetical protein
MNERQYSQNFSLACERVGEVPLEFGSSVHSLCAAQHDPFGIAEQCVQLSPLAAREVSALALAEQFFCSCLFLFGQPILWPQRVKLFADRVPAPLPSADNHSVCLATALDNAGLIILHRTV